MTKIDFHSPTLLKNIIYVLSGLLILSIGVLIYFVIINNDLQESQSKKIDLGSENCIAIDAIPISITSPGTYCLTNDFNTNETAIIIQTDNVEIDFNGHKLQGPAIPESMAIGVNWNSQHNITIKNGTIEGFFYGINGSAPYDELTTGKDSAASNISIENMILLNNSFRGIRVDASKATIIENLIQCTGGTTVYSDAYSMGIEVIGPQCQIQANRIMETYPVGVGEGVAISLSNNVDGCVVIDNYISNDAIPFPGRSFAFWVTGKAKDVQISHNYAQGFTYPFKYTNKEIIIARNTFSKMECSIEDYPDYYQDYPYTQFNQFLFEVPGCISDDPSTFLPLAEEGDPLAMFRLAIMSDDRCEAKEWYEKAAALDHSESLRILDLYKDSFDKAGCP